MRLRKLTRKSILGFGKYSEATVQNLLDMKYHNYLRWVYFCNSHINFFDDILEEIKVSEDYKIEKPGKDPNKLEILNEYLRGRITSLTKLKIKARSKKLQKHEVARQAKIIRFSNKKDYLRNLNQKK